MHPQLPWTAFLNKYLGGLVAAVLEALGIHPHDPHAPISNFVAMEILVAILLLVFFVAVRSRLSVDRPGALQHIMEGLHGFIEGQSQEIIGHHSEKFTPFLVTLGLFILVCNLIGMVPAFESPTANPSVPLGCAICAFLYYNYQGMKKQGVLSYLKHFAGPMPLMAPLMSPIELISHVGRLLSLTVRLYANMFAGEQVTLVFMGLVPLFVPAAFMGLHVFVAFLQALVFALLTMIYVSSAVSHEH